MASSFQYELKETLLKADDISLKLNGNEILKGVNVEIKNIVRPGLQQGQVVGFLGPSGIGKSKFSEILAGVLQPNSGSVLIGVDQQPVSIGSVGFVQQKYPLFEHRTVLGNLQVIGNLRIKDKAIRKERIESFLNRFNLWQHKNKYPAQLSGGMRQRLAIGQALISSENFLIMDEPFSGLDINMIAEVSSFIKELTTMNELITIIIISHDITATASIADTLWIMGRDRDQNGNIIPGSHIKYNYNLVDMDLAWHENLNTDPRFLSLTSEIKGLFKSL